MIDKKLLESLEDIVGELQRDKVSTKQVIETLRSLVNFYATKKLKVLSLTDEEHEFLWEELSANRHRSQELFDDNNLDLEKAQSELSLIFSKGDKDAIDRIEEKSIRGRMDYVVSSKELVDCYKREVRLTDSIIKKL